MKNQTFKTSLDHTHGPDEDVLASTRTHIAHGERPKLVGGSIHDPLFKNRKGPQTRQLDQKYYFEMITNLHLRKSREERTGQVLLYAVKIRRNPWPLVFISVPPLFILGFISLILLLAEHDFTSLLEVISSVLVALFAYVPVIREKLPPSPENSRMDHLVVIVIVVAFLVLFEAAIQQAIVVYYRYPDASDPHYAGDGNLTILFENIKIVTAVVIIGIASCTTIFFAVKYLEWRTWFFGLEKAIARKQKAIHDAASKQSTSGVGLPNREDEMMCKVWGDFYQRSEANAADLGWDDSDSDGEEFEKGQSLDFQPLQSFPTTQQPGDFEKVARLKRKNPFKKNKSPNQVHPADLEK